MKRIMSALLAGWMLMALVSCGEGDTKGSEPTVTEDPKVNAESTSDTQGTAEQPGTDITMEDVLAHPESPADDFFCGEDSNGNLVLFQYLGDDEIVVIPEAINGKPIVKINQFVFSNDSPVKGIKLSSTVKEIDDYTFSMNKKLQYVVFGDSVETVGESSFQGCTFLKEVAINSKVKLIKKLAFAQCKALKSITLPDTIETIENIAFYTMADDFKIVGKAGSVAETYANSANIAFEAK